MIKSSDTSDKSRDGAEPQCYTSRAVRSSTGSGGVPNRPHSLCAAKLHALDRHGAMRIIAGKAKGMRLQAPEGNDVRPSSDKLRGALMSQLGGFFDGESMLDVCAGTGAMALEFLSRGCGHAVAIEPDPAALTVLRRNAQHTRLADRLEVRAGPAQAQLLQLAKEGRRFDFIFVDPPWQSGLYAPILELIRMHGLLAPAGQLIVESDKALAPELWQPWWALLAERRYGAATLVRLEAAQ